MDPQQNEPEAAQSENSENIEPAVVPDNSQALVLVPGKGEEHKEPAKDATPEQLQKQEKQAQDREMKEVKKAIGLVYNTKKPKHAGDGITSGVGNVVKGTGAGLVAWGAMTYAGGKEQGVKGVFKGFGLGALAAGGLAAAGAVTGVSQIGRGIVNTPGTIRNKAKGKDWDPEKRCYYDYYLNDELIIYLEKNDEQFMEEYENEYGKYQGFGEEFKEMMGQSEKVKDTKLYDALGVKPDATQNQIRKAYYKLARETHPDKVGDTDPLAKEKFQVIGHAYQILIDENLRKKYDEQGEEGLKETQTMDSKLIFEMIFGSDKFEPLIGELALSQMAQMADDKPPEFLDFKQKRREVQIALNLSNSLTLFAADEVAKSSDLQQEILASAQELSSTPMGKLLLGKIGMIYIEQAKQELGGVKAMGAHVGEWKGGVKQKASIAGAFYKTYKSATKLHKQEMKEEQEQLKKAKEESKAAAEADASEAQPQDAKTDAQEREKKEEDAQAREIEKMKLMADSMMDVAFYMTVLDIEKTLRAAVKRLFRDKGVDKKSRKQRARGLQMIGQVYLKHGETNLKKGLKIMKEQLSGQMGGPGPQQPDQEEPWEEVEKPNTEEETPKTEEMKQ